MTSTHDQILELLADKGVTYGLIQLSGHAMTVNDVVTFSKGDIMPEEICKTLIVQGKKTGKLSAVLMRGADRLDFSALKKILGEETRIAGEQEVRTAARTEPGAVCPFFLTVPLFVDENVFKLTKINVGSGNHMIGLEISTDALKQIVNYNVALLAKN